VRGFALLLVAALSACASGRGASGDAPNDAPAAEAADPPTDASEEPDAVSPDVEAVSDDTAAGDEAATADEDADAVQAEASDADADVAADTPADEVASCPDACAPLWLGCVAETHRGSCEDPDGDGPACPEWTDVHPCAAGEECTQGVCIAAPCRPACPEMVLVPAGPFRMGCNDGSGVCPTNACDNGWSGPKELPCHEVTPRAFCIDRFEVTVDAYQRFINAVPGAPPPHELDEGGLCGGHSPPVDSGGSSKLGRHFDQLPPSE